jgi:hypothetical protein
VILWSGEEKCPTGGVREILCSTVGPCGHWHINNSLIIIHTILQETIKKWGFLEKGKLMHECTDSPDITNLEEFVTNQMMVHSGGIPHQLIGENRYFNL